MRLYVTALLLTLFVTLGVTGEAFALIPSTATSSGNTVSAESSTLEVNRAGTGSGTISGSGISCGSDCTEDFLPDTSVSLTASPGSGSAFGGWSGDCSGASATTMVSMAVNRTCTATFNAVSAPPVGQPPQEEPEEPAAVDEEPAPIDTTVNPTEDTLVSAEDESVSIEIPAGAVERQTRFLVRQIDELPEDKPIPEGTVRVGNRSYVFEATDEETGEPVTSFAQPLTIIFQLTPQEIADVADEIVVAFWNGTEWIQVPTTVDPETGQVVAVTYHFTTFTVLNVGSVTQQLVSGGNFVTFTGPTGTLTIQVEEKIGSGLESIWRLNADTQEWEVWVANGPAFANSLKSLRQRDALFLLMSEPVDWTTTNIIPAPGGVREVVLKPGWNTIGYVGPDNLSIKEQLLQDVEIAGLVEALWVFDSQEQAWAGFFPNLPAFVSEASEVDRLDALFIVLASEEPVGLVLPEIR